METERACPVWAVEMIANLRSCEVMLGNIPRDFEWDSKYVKEVAQKTFLFDSLPVSEKLIDLVFKKITTQLIQEGFSSQEIAIFINDRIKYQNSPPYCSVEEVEESLT
jgi:hypothetical protein